jgi:hypothetical protein
MTARRRNRFIQPTAGITFESPDSTAPRHTLTADELTTARSRVAAGESVDDEARRLAMRKARELKTPDRKAK